MKSHRRALKSDPLVTKVFINGFSSPYRAEVIFLDSGKSSTVSTRPLSRAPEKSRRTEDVTPMLTNKSILPTVEPKLSSDDESVILMKNESEEQEIISLQD